METQSTSNVDVPLWALSHFGKRVRLSKPWKDSTRTYRAGDVALLDGITHMKSGANRALLIFDRDEDDTLLVDVPFDCIAAPTGLPADLLSLVKSIPGRAGEIAFMWLHGFDLRKRIPKPTLYRYRRQLLAHSIDILAPVVATKGA